MCDIRVRITEAIRDKDVKTIERLVQEVSTDLDESPDSNYVASVLKLNVIHGQIFLQHYFKWKQTVKERQINLAKKMFS